MSKKPTHKISVISGDGKDAFFTRVGSLWQNSDGSLSGQIRDGLAISGRVYIGAIKAKEDDHDPETGEVYTKGGQQ